MVLAVPRQNKHIKISSRRGLTAIPAKPTMAKPTETPGKTQFLAGLIALKHVRPNTGPFKPVNQPGMENYAYMNGFAFETSKCLLLVSTRLSIIFPVLDQAGPRAGVTGPTAEC